MEDDSVLLKVKQAHRKAVSNLILLLWFLNVLTKEDRGTIFKEYITKHELTGRDIVKLMLK